MTISEDLVYQILSIVAEIPEGKVATYGLIAKLAGMDNNSRLVGRVLKMTGVYGDFPSHRVVNHNGRLVPGWMEQKELLLNEGVIFKNDNVDLKQSLFKF